MTVPAVEVERGDDGAVRVSLSGEWRLSSGPPSADAAVTALSPPGTVGVSVDAGGVTGWDSALVAYLAGLSRICRERGLPLSLGSVPEGAQRLVALAEAVPERVGARHQEPAGDVLEEIGLWAGVRWKTLGDRLDFLGGTVVAVGRMLIGRARFRRADFVLVLQQAGHEALPIACLISFLLGSVLAFVGAVQLQQFGASIFVANLVGVGVVRETGALMTGIVMAGRTGASFAALLGTMTVNEEIDALETLGLDPIEYLVAPRIVALAMMTPLLVAFADLVGVLGGLLVGVTLLDLGPTQYLVQTRDALGVNHLLVGLVKAVFFGKLVAFAGCYHGLRCGRSAQSVGVAATAAVVSGIVAVVVCDAAFTVLFHLLGV